MQRFIFLKCYSFELKYQNSNNPKRVLMLNCQVLRRPCDQILYLYSYNISGYTRTRCDLSTASYKIVQRRMNMKSRTLELRTRGLYDLNTYHKKKNLIWSLSINNLKFYIYVYRYRLREKQRADFDLNLREDMQKATKNE